MIGPIVGMVHLGPLPGSPRFEDDFDAVIAAAVADAVALADAGFDAVLIENYGDAPYHPDDVPKVTVAAMTRAVAAVATATPLPIGVNVLRNDARAAVAIAAVTGASFIRVNILSGWMSTDQGPIVGRAADVARLRAELGGDLLIAADVMVKHAAPPAGWSLAEAARDTWERGGTDALIISGTATGAAVDDDDVATVRREAPQAPLLIGSGVTVATATSLLEVADGIIVGTSVKRDGVTDERVDPSRALALVEAARRSTGEA
jgi:membrane complex biogenesis BtpA family protein